MRKRTSPIWLAEPEEFATVISNAKTYVDVLRHFGLSPKGSNSVNVKLRIKEEGLSIEHFNANEARTHLRRKKQ